MRIHVLGIGSIGSLVSFHLHQNLRNDSRHALSLILSRRGIPQSPSSRLHEEQDVGSSSQGTASRGNDFTISVESDGQAHTASGFQTEIIGKGLETARTDVSRIRDLLHTSGSLQHDYLTQKLNTALQHLRGPSTPSSRISSLIVTLKCQDTLKAIEQLKDRIRPDTCITLLQNGMGVYDALCEKVWPDAETRPDFILGSTTHGAKTRLRFGVEGNADSGGEGSGTGRREGRQIVHTGLGKVQFGIVPDPRGNVNYDERLWPDLVTRNKASVVALPDSPQPPLPSLSLPSNLSASDNLSNTLNLLLGLTDLSPSLLPIHLMQHTLLLKLAVNCAINPLTAIYQLPNGFLHTNDSVDKLVRQICVETSAVILAYFKSLSMDGRHDPFYVAPADYHPPVIPSEVSTLFSPISLRTRVRNVAASTAKNTSSMLADIQAARPTEIDYINGYIVRLGKRLGVPTPVNTLMMNMVKAQSNLAYNRKAASRMKRGRKGAAGKTDGSAGEE